MTDFGHEERDAQMRTTGTLTSTTAVSPPVDLRDDEPLVFADDDAAESAAQAVWRVLVADDDEEVHAVTRMVLSELTFDDRPIELHHVYSGAEAVETVRNEAPFAVLLLDVVMESDDAGLLAVKAIRDQLGERALRIVLRTGQPGHAPEQRVIRDYDINDYREKTELTANKLHTTMYAALRSYRDIVALANHKRGLEQVIEASSRIFRESSVDHFADTVLRQLQSLLFGSDRSHTGTPPAGVAAMSKPTEAPRVYAGTGRFEGCVGSPVESIPRRTAVQNILSPPRGPRGQRGATHFVGNFTNRSGSHNVVFVEGDLDQSDTDAELLELFGRNVSIAYENLLLRDDIEATLRDIIYRLSEVVENRSRETGNHVRRVAEFCRILGEGCGLTSEQIQLLWTAAPLHDIGKVAISDAVLNKPGRLTPEEYDLMKTHASIGEAMLDGSREPVFQAASIIAGQHHERWDGKGYPRGLAGEEIHLFGRIAAVADVFDALCSERCYKPAWPLERALELFRDERGHQFDPHVVDVFFERLEDILEIQQRFADTFDDDERGTG